MKCATVFPILIAKTERKERTRENVYRPMCTAQAQRGKCHHAQAECLPVQSLPRTPAKHRTVEYYAAMLNISSKYLTVICKKNSGKTANQWIQEYTLSAITKCLRTTEMSVKEISFLLGFPNTSFFGKYVKDHLGCSPLEYRRRTRG